jgi:hypothetical protein
MRLRLVAAILLLAALALASRNAEARPAQLGISAGVIDDEVDSDEESNRTLGLFGRVGLTKRLAGQLEVMKIATDDATYTPTTIRVATVLLVVDLVDSGRWVPTLKVGAGIDRASTDYDTTEGTHYEGGFGLEYRADDGFTIGLDLRMGGRSVEEEPDYALEGRIAPLIYDGGGLREGEYRAARLTIGLIF